MTDIIILYATIKYVWETMWIHHLPESTAPLRSLSKFYLALTSEVVNTSDSIAGILVHNDSLLIT